MNVGLFVHNLIGLYRMCHLANKLYVINSLHELNLNWFIKRASFIEIVNIKTFMKKNRKKPNRTEVFCCTEPNRTEGLANRHTPTCYFHGISLVMKLQGGTRLSQLLRFYTLSKSVKITSEDTLR